MEMDFKRVYQLRISVFFSKQYIRILMAEADSFTHRAGILTDSDEVDRVVRKFFVFSF
jgi:hypothetical protein